MTAARTTHRPRASLALLATTALVTSTFGVVANHAVAGEASTSDAAPAADAVRVDGGSVLERTVFSSGKSLTGPSDAAPEAVVLAYVKAHPQTFGLTSGDADGLRTSRVQVTPDGVGHVVLTQWHSGLRIHTANLVGTVDPQGRLVMVSGRSTPTAAATGAVELTAGEAIVASAEEAGVSDATAPEGSDTTRRGELEFDNQIAEGVANPEPLRAEQVWSITDGGLRRGWLTEVEADGQTWVSSVVDAQTGEVLSQQSRYSHAGPEGTVFTDQNPDADPTRTVQPFTGVNGTWVSGTVTNGNNVNAYRDLTDADSTGYQPNVADQHFTFPFTDAWRALPDGTDLDDIPAAQRDAALDADLDAIITQLFYYTNDMHDWLWGFGFDEASGNFQVTNFSGDGSDGDAVQAEAQDGFDFACSMGAARCLNNANFGTNGDGSTARMQMFMWARPDRPYRDGSLDGDVIAHEYGHGVSNRLVPGTLSGATDQAGSLGEGWSDTLSFLRWGDDTVGEYVTGNATRGIRNFAYTSHPWTYGDYSTGVGSPHRNGEIWAATTFDVRQLLGINLTTQLVLDGMRSTGNGPSPTFLDARDGILANDQAANGGANRCALWVAFAGRGMGVDAVSNGLHAVPTEDFDVPAECLPTADAGGPYTTDEGTDVLLSAAGSTPGTDPSSGALTDYAWDLDNDGDFDDATGPSPTFDTVGQDGVFTIGLQVTDEWGLTDTDTTTVTVDNVAPTVTLDPIAPIEELGTVTVSGVVSDPGWLDPLTATVDFDDGMGPQPLAGVVENVRPDATLTFSVDKQYGDNGTFTITVVGADDDTSSQDTVDAVVTNVDPTATIDETGATTYDGATAFVVPAGEPLDVPVDATDPGSDDLTFSWAWGDGVVDQQVSLVNPPAADPAKSPTVQPRDVGLTGTHTYAEACLYQLDVTVQDDDGGVGTDSAAVVIVGNEEDARSTGWWKHQLRGNGKTEFTDAELQCLLDITGFFSIVFEGLTIEDGVAIMHSPPKNDERTKFDVVALANWLNFANGAVGFDDEYRVNGSSGTGATFGGLMEQAELVRANPASTQEQLRVHRQILQRMLGG